MAPNFHVLSDAEIRSELKRKIRARYRKHPDALVIDELGLDYGAARIDIAVINERLVGYEIKSDGDNLYRLPDQIRIYNRVFDQVTLVVGYRHAFHALQTVPTWWGVRLVSRCESGKIEFSTARQASNNPAIDAIATVRLLWRDEVLMLLAEYNAIKGMKSKPRIVLCTKLAEILPFEELRRRVRNQLKARTNWRVDLAPMSDGD